MLTKLQELREANATLKKDAKNNYQKKMICKGDLKKAKKEVDKVKKAYTELEKDVDMRVHNTMEEHIENFLKSSTFDNIVNLYWHPIAILVFSDCRKKVKVQYPKINVTSITFGEQEGGVEEDRERSIVDFHPEVKLKWDKDSEGRTIFPLNIDFKFVAIDKEGSGGDGSIEVTD